MVVGYVRQMSGAYSDRYEKDVELLNHVLVTEHVRIWTGTQETAMRELHGLPRSQGSVTGYTDSSSRVRSRGDTLQVSEELQTRIHWD